MKLLVTGGMGFIGSNFIRYVRATHPEYDIINFDALTYAGNPENLEDVEQGEGEALSGSYRFVKGDIADLLALHDAIARYTPDAIINFAAESHVDRSFVDCGEFIRSNVLGAHNLFECSRKYGIRMVHVSTDEIYGEVLEGYSSELSPMRPSNPYAASKAAADMQAQSYIRTHRAPILVVRGSNNFGPYQYPEKLIPLAITNMLEGEKVPVHGTGAHIRTWVHVLDFVRGIDLVLHEAKEGETYNIAGGEYANIDILKRIGGTLGVRMDDAVVHVGDRPGADLRYAPDAEKIGRELGWRPEYSIDGHIEEVVAWYKAHRNWWKKIKRKTEFLQHYEKQRTATYY
jgi:dTDP-glucose 4,6-dehydratase